MNTAEVIFKALSDETRLRCMVLLVDNPELCVCELCHALVVSQPKMSRHLAALREAGLVSDRKHGLWVFYRINQALPEWVRTVLSVTVAGVAAREPFASDRERLRLMAPEAERCRVA